MIPLFGRRVLYLPPVVSRVLQPMTRFFLVGLTGLAFAASSFAGQPLLKRNYGKWDVVGREDPMDGWKYQVRIDGVVPLTTMSYPYHETTASLVWSCGSQASAHTASIRVHNAPRIGRLRWMDIPESAPLPFANLAEFADSRGLVRVRWDQHPPTEIKGWAGEADFIAFFTDPLEMFTNATGDSASNDRDDSLVDQDALSGFLSDLTQHSTLLIEIPWNNTENSPSHFRIPLNGVADAIAFVRGRCPDPRGNLP